MSRVKHVAPALKGRCGRCRLTLPIDELVEQPGAKPLCRRCLTVRAQCSRCCGLAHRRDVPRCRTCRQPYAAEPAPEPWGFGHSNIADAEVEG